MVWLWNQANPWGGEALGSKHLVSHGSRPLDPSL